MDENCLDFFVHSPRGGREKKDGQEELFLFRVPRKASLAGSGVILGCRADALP